MRGRHRTSAGFSLLEVMMALVITSLVLGMVYSSFSAVMETRERVSAAANTNMTARLVLSRMVREIESAFIVQRAEDAPPESRYTLFEGAQDEIDGRAADRISFTTFAHTKRGRNADESDQSVISYSCETFLDDEGREEQLALMRREWRRIAPPGETQTYEPVPIPIAEGIEGFRLRFMQEGSDWAEEWSAADVRTLDALPIAVEITLSLPDGRGGVKAYRTVANTKIDPISREAGAPGSGETVIDEEGGAEGGEETGTAPPAAAGGTAAGGSSGGAATTGSGATGSGAPGSERYQW